VLAEISHVAERPTTVLVTGETGTGKGLIAQEIHDRSLRHGRLVNVTCGSHAPLADVSKKARGGTLYLNEVGDASPTLQAELLRLLADPDYQRKADVRIVAGTHRDLAETGFHQDLFIRLNQWSIRAPSLHERREDIPHLVAAFAAKHSGRPMTIARRLMLALLRARWPGNLRQLNSIVERLVVHAGESAELTAAPWLAKTLA